MTEARREFEAQLRRHMDVLYFSALDLSGNSSDAEDIVQEAALKGLRRFDSFQPGTDFKALFIHNDDMGIGAIEALKAAGVKPGDVKIVSVDGTRGGFQAMVDGWFQADVECNPLLGPQVYEMAFKLKNGQPVDRNILTNETVYYPDKAAELLPSRQY